MSNEEVKTCEIMDEFSSKNPRICNETLEDFDSITETSDDASSVEVGVESDEGLECETSASEQSSTGQKLRSTSSSSSFTVHVCPYEECDKFFSRPFRLKQHIRTHTGERPYVCPSKNCKKSYTRQQHLTRHIETSHFDKESKETVKCVICDKMITNLWSLKKHLHRFHERKKPECTECGKCFSKQQQLQSHTYVHTGINPFSCDYPGCKIRCRTPSRLKRHKLTHQKNRYVCPQESCQQKFDIYKDLQQHIASSHQKVCDICGRPFEHLRFLKKHRLTHENTVEAYFCTHPACDRFYYQLKNLKTHIKEKHQHLRIYECGICEKRLSSKQKLIHHMTTHDPGYKRNYTSDKLRKVRKDKGSSRRDVARLLSGYTGSGEDTIANTLSPETSSQNETCRDTCDGARDETTPTVTRGACSVPSFSVPPDSCLLPRVDDTITGSGTALALLEDC